MSDALQEKSNAETPMLSSSAGMVVEGRYVPPPTDKQGKVWVRTTALIHSDPEPLYQLWRNVQNAPQWQEQITQVTQINDTDEKEWNFVKARIHLAEFAVRRRHPPHVVIELPPTLKNPPWRRC